MTSGGDYQGDDAPDAADYDYPYEDDDGPSGFEFPCPRCNGTAIISFANLPLRGATLTDQGHGGLSEIIQRMSSAIVI